MNYHFLKVCTVTPKMELGNCKYNIAEIEKAMKEIAQNNASVAIFPELCTTGYSCADLFFQANLVEETEKYVQKLLQATKELELLAVIGAPVSVENHLYNVAIVMCKGQILGMVPKMYLPNYSEFYEKRWFAPAAQLTKKEVTYAGQTCPISTQLTFKCNTIPYLTLGVEICEDLWATLAPSTLHSIAGATILANLSASNEIIGKADYRRAMLMHHSAKTMSAYLYSSSSVNESTTDLVFSGHQLIYENGYCLNESALFSKDTTITYGIVDLERLHKERLKQNNMSPIHLVQNYKTVTFDMQPTSFVFDRPIDPKPFVPQDTEKRNERCRTIFDIQAHGLARRLTHTHVKSLVFGMSGGLDSTLALLVCLKAVEYANLPRTAIIGITMPGFGTTDRTYKNAVDLMNLLGITVKEISIVKATKQHLEDIEHPLDKHDVTYENAQARERTKILMDLANKYNGLVIGTGDLSELALGWATFNGDHMSMYGVNSSIPKTLVRYLVDYVARYESEPMVQEILFDILDTPVSPELLPPSSEGHIVQKTEDLVGPYELHDFFMYYMVRFGYRPSKIFFLAQQAFKGTFDDQTIFKWLTTFYRRFFAQQFKRSTLPDGPKVGSVCLSPRGDWRMPSDASSALWLEEINQLQKELEL